MKSLFYEFARGVIEGVAPVFSAIEFDVKFLFFCFLNKFRILVFETGDMHGEHHLWLELIQRIIDTFLNGFRISESAAGNGQKGDIDGRF